MSKSSTKTTNKKAAEVVVTCTVEGCGRKLPLELHPTIEGRLIAYCDCGANGRRAVYEGPTIYLRNSADEATELPANEE